MSAVDMAPRDEIRSSKRLAALKRTNLLDTPPEEAFDRLTRLATMIIGAPTSLVSLVDSERQFFKSVSSSNENLVKDRETPLSYSFCQHAVHSRRDLLIEDARMHPLVQNNPAIVKYDILSYAGIPLIDDDGHALGAFCVMDSETRQWTSQEIEILRELAALVLTEMKLRSTVIGLREIDRMRSELIAVISHDLRNPLTAILGSSSLLLSRGDSMDAEDKNSFLQTIHHQGERMLKMTEDMLRRSKAEAAQAPMEQKPVDLTAILERVVETFKAADRSTKFAVQGPADAIVIGDEGMIEQVVTNLLDNARKYSDEGSPIKAQVTVEDKRILLEVADRGRGIEEDLLPTIFQPFQQVDDAQDISMGVGLGLHIVRNFVELHGGSVEVASRKGEGSTFTVALPAPNL